MKVIGTGEKKMGTENGAITQVNAVISATKHIFLVVKFIMPSLIVWYNSIIPTAETMST